MSKKKYAIPLTIQSAITDRINAFNNKHLSKTVCKYVPTIKGKFIYLMRITHAQSFEPICRLTYNDDLENMDFAIFKFSSEKYDPNEFFFPGQSLIDGTLEGAMKAGLKAYPI